MLHPIAGVSGEPCTIEYCDGRVEQTRFPGLINPVQPMMNLRAVTHHFAPGFSVTCRMEGDTFEMEDQRNWTDASYKTYVRPLALPWPYTLPAGSRLMQRVALSVSAAPEGTATRKSEIATLSFQPSSGLVPPLGFGLDPDDLAETLQVMDTLKKANPHHVVIAYDPGRGHDTKTLEKMVDAGKHFGAALWLEAVVRSLDDFEEEIATLGQTVRKLGSPFSTLLISPAPDLKCTLPGSPWPPCPDLAAIYRAARKAFPGVRLGGGMFAYFTELNRKRPPVEWLDMVSFTTIALMHAGDDRSATEGLESLPAMADSVRAFIDGKPFHVGPSAIGMRANPYGEAPMANPRNIRQAMNRMDPRQRGLFAAAWSVGYFSHFARGGAAAISLGGGAGDFGLAHTRSHYAKPWYDQHGGVYPVFHVFKGLSALNGLPSISVDSTLPRAVQSMAALIDGRLEVWVANLTGVDQQVQLPDAPLTRVVTLDEHSFSSAAADTDFWESHEQALDRQQLDLHAYAVARLRA